MFQSRKECPHCGNHVDFCVVNMAQYNVQDPSLLHWAVDAPQYEADTMTDAYGTACCPQCHSPVLFIFRATWNQISEILKCSNNGPRVFRGKPPLIVATFPEVKAPYCDNSYPDEIKELFVAAQELLHQNSSPPLIISACGSVLEVSLQRLGAKGKRFVDMIDDCLNQGIITRPLAGWAHHLRLERNKAAHEIKASHADAEEAIAFLAFFLNLTFVIPADIKKKQQI